MQNPEMMQQMLNNPMVEAMMSNPAIMENLIASNPELQRLIGLVSVPMC